MSDKSLGQILDEVKFESPIKEVVIEDYGIINFGVYKGNRYESLPIDYLKYLISDECKTTKKNKETAKKVLLSKHDIPGQIKLF